MESKLKSQAMDKKDLTQERLKQVFHYDPDTGIFKRLIATSKNVKVGDIAGFCDGETGYLRICIDWKTYKAHRLAWLYMYGHFPKKNIDHIDHNRKNNKINNLREATTQENAKNISLPKANTTGFVGVYWFKANKKWHAQIRVNNKLIHLGFFKNIDDAIKARKEANIKYGYHENHGVKNEK